jgi:hypothetical protein
MWVPTFETGSQGNWALPQPRVQRRPIAFTYDVLIGLQIYSGRIAVPTGEAVVQQKIAPDRE